MFAYHRRDRKGGMQRSSATCRVYRKAHNVIYCYMKIMVVNESTEPVSFYQDFHLRYN